MNFILKNSFPYIIFYSILIYKFCGISYKFSEVLSAFIDNPLTLALKDGFSLTKKFLNLKVLLILIGENIFLMVSILNGSFTGLIYFINLIISFYLIEFYLEEKK